MKMVKSLVLGSAAGLIAMSGAQAADLPVKAKAVEYVRICSLYGAGFYYIPGTDTCIKLSGYLRTDVLVNTNSDASGNTSGAGGAQNRFTDAYLWRARQDLSIDTRTATEYGVVRTFADLTFSWTDDNYAGNGAGATAYGPIGSGTSLVATPNNATSGGVAGGTLGMYYAFIQFAGFTMGKAVSPFSAPWQNYPGNNFDGLVGGGGTVTGVNQFVYTAQFGNGVSATVGVQDQTAYYQAGVNNLSAGGLFGASDYANTVAPDIIGVVSIDQAWGTLQFSAAGHDNHAAYYGSGTLPFSGTEFAGHPDDKWGWAVQAALSIKNIPTGAGDVINIQGVYTNGATRYNIQDLSIAGAVAYFGGTSVPGAYQSLGLGTAVDSVFATGTSQQLTSTWGMRGAFNHNWNPYWSSALYGAYAGIMYNGTAKSLICGTTPGFTTLGFGLGSGANAGITKCDPNYQIGQLGFITRWTPVKNLTFSGDFTWTHLDQNFSGVIASPAAASTLIGKPATTYALSDQDTFTLLLRAQRNF
jgi:hypothetical protein